MPGLSLIGACDALHTKNALQREARSSRRDHYTRKFSSHYDCLTTADPGIVLFCPAFLRALAEAFRAAQNSFFVITDRLSQVQPAECSTQLTTG
jgi:hypothetical protein